MKKIVAVFVLLFVLTGCSSKTNMSEENMQKAKEAIIEQEFEKAQGFIDLVLEDSPKDAEAKAYQKQLDSFQKGRTQVAKQEYNGAKKAYESVLKIKEGSNQMIRYAEIELDALEERIKKEQSESEESTATSDSEDVEIDPSQAQTDLERYEELPTTIKVQLIATTVDTRALPKGYRGLDKRGLDLVYDENDDDIVFKISSGVGSGHPYFVVKEEDDFIIPVGGIVRSGPDGAERLTDVDTTPVSKEILYQRYAGNKEPYDEGQEVVKEASNIRDEQEALMEIITKQEEIEKAEKEKAEKERLEKEKAEKERLEKEAKEQAEKEKLEKAKKAEEKKKLEKEKAESSGVQPPDDNERLEALKKDISLDFYSNGSAGIVEMYDVEISNNSNATIIIDTADLLLETRSLSEVDTQPSHYIEQRQLKPGETTTFEALFGLSEDAPDYLNIYVLYQGVELYEQLAAIPDFRPE